MCRMCQGAQTDQCWRKIILTYFRMQMFASPGVRKDERNNQELGEDATGFVVENNYAAVWIADGAPGRSIKLGSSNFKSRVLAKYIGSCFEALVFKDEKPRMLLDKGFYEEFKNELDKKLRAHLSIICEQLNQMKNSLSLDIFSKRSIGGEISYLFEWSTTFAGAVINIENKECSLMLIGDCMALVDDKIITDQSNRLFVSWVVNEKLEFVTLDIIAKSPSFNTMHDTKSIILMSDGAIGCNELAKNCRDKDIETFWDELKSMNTITDDDKTAIFFEFPR
jgi:Protein phosphatase 2C